jgi:hypothetical protein
MKTYLFLALVAAVWGYLSGLKYMEKRGPALIPEGASPQEAALIQHDYDFSTQVGALFMAGHGILVVTFLLTLGMGFKLLLVNLWKAPAAFREGYRDREP